MPSSAKQQQPRLPNQQHHLAMGELRRQLNASASYFIAPQLCLFHYFTLLSLVTHMKILFTSIPMSLLECWTTLKTSNCSPSIKLSMSKPLNNFTYEHLSQVPLISVCRHYHAFNNYYYYSVIAYYCTCQLMYRIVSSITFLCIKLIHKPYFVL